MAHPNRIASARVVVFGGTSGIGFATASLCLSSGAHVTISGSNQPKIDKTLQRLRSAYPDMAPEQVNGYPVDLADSANVEESLKELFEKVTEGGTNKVDHIVFTAGDSLKLPKLGEVTLEAFYDPRNVRVNGVVLIAKLLSTGKYMEASPSSSFTFTGGVNTQKPAPGWSLTAAWGGLKEGLMRGLAVDLKPIRVNLVSPGAVKTELFDGLPTAMLEKVIDSMGSKTLVGRVGAPEDTAEAYAFLMKDSFVTGTVVETNGGYLLTGSFTL